MEENTKKGIILNFQEQAGSLAATLTAYIKKTPGTKGSKKQQRNLIEDIITLAGIDKDIWRVKEFKLTPNVWGVTMKQMKYDAESTSLGQTNAGLPMKDFKASSKSWAEQAHNYQLKVEIKFERPPMEENVLESFKEIVKDMPEVEINIVKRFRKRPHRTGIAAEIATVDAHAGKLAWERETGYRNYDLSIAIKDYKYVSEKGADHITSYKPELIVDIEGNDLYHMDNMVGHTTKGEHTLDVDGRITKIHSKVFSITRDKICMLRKIAPVKVIWIPGNHDFLASYMLCFALKEHFKNDPLVTVDIGENPRKAMLWGNLLVGWTHQIKGKWNLWVNELPQQFPKMWGESKFREWHVGDQHKKVTTKVATPLNTVGGVTIRQLTALSPVDKWHTDNLFTDAVPGGDVFLWDKQEGVFANFTIWTGQYDDHRNNLIKSHKDDKVG